MPTPLPPNSIIESRIYYRYNGQICINVLHYQYTGGTVADYAGRMAALNAKINGAGGLTAAMSPLQSPDCEIFRIDSQPVYPQRLAAITLSLSQFGTAAVPNLPQNVAATIEKRSDIAARYGVGSYHLGGLTTFAIVNGMVTAGGITNLGAVGSFLTQTLTTGIGPDMVPLVWSAKVPTRVTPFNRYIVQATGRVMRRRTVGVGK